MTDTLVVRERFGKAFLLALALGISLVFFLMVRHFLVAVLLAAIFSGMAQPVYRWLLALFRGRRPLASAATILVVLGLIVVPLAGFLGIVTSQAISVSESVAPWVDRQINQPDELDRLLNRLPFMERFQSRRDQITAKLGELAGRVGVFLVNSLAALSRGTVVFFLNFFIMLYAMFFFLADGRRMLERILYYMPLSSADEKRMVDRFVSVARATIKGTVVIGVVQGALAGLGFFVAGINGAAFWGTVMAVLSIIPGVGTALVWVPAAVYLVAVGKGLAAVLLVLWCVLVVGTVDNVLRPRLVGRDTKMSDLLVLLSTLGGLVLFGAVGVIIGPIVAALFVTVWDIYGEAFKDVLPDRPAWMAPIDSSSGTS